MEILNANFEQQLWCQLQIPAQEHSRDYEKNSHEGQGSILSVASSWEPLELPHLKLLRQSQNRKSFNTKLNAQQSFLQFQEKTSLSVLAFMYNANLQQLCPRFSPLYPFWILFYLTCGWSYLGRFGDQQTNIGNYIWNSLHSVLLEIYIYISISLPHVGNA